MTYAEIIQSHYNAACSLYTVAEIDAALVGHGGAARKAGYSRRRSELVAILASAEKEAYKSENLKAEVVEAFDCPSVGELKENV